MMKVMGYWPRINLHPLLPLKPTDRVQEIIGYQFFNNLGIINWENNYC
jgi:hypothetical protein